MRAFSWKSAWLMGGRAVCVHVLFVGSLFAIERKSEDRDERGESELCVFFLWHVKKEEMMSFGLASSRELECETHRLG